MLGVGLERRRGEGLRVPPVHPVKFSALNPWFVRYGERVLPHVNDLANAQGLVCECPCGDHSLIVWFADRGVPEAAEPKPRWTVSGSSIEDLTLSPSIHVPTGCCWHGFIRAGEVVNA